MFANFRNDTNIVFYSKIDAWLVVVIALASVLTIGTCGTLCMEAQNSSSSESMLFAILFLSFEIALFLLIADAFIRCRYIFKEDYLYMQSGIFIRIKIPYKNIKSFCESNNVLSAPACSIDRIKIVYENEKTKKEYFTLVSPRDKQGFSETLSIFIGQNK